MHHFTQRLILIACLLLISAQVSAQKDTTGMSLDIGFARGRNINLWPLVKISRGKEKKEVQILYPFYKMQYLGVEGYKHRHLFPAFWYDSSATGQDLRIISSCYPSLISLHSEKKDDLHSFKFMEIAPYINLVEYTRSTNGAYLKNNVFFFLWYKNNEALKQEHLVVFPLYWRYRNGNDVNTLLLPVYAHGKYGYGTRSYTAITPLFWHLNDKKDFSKNILFPVYWGRQDKNENRQVIFPLLWTRSLTNPKDSSKATSLVLFPLFWDYNSKYERNTTLFPLVWNRNNKHRESFTLFPLFSVYKSKLSERSRFLTPLYYHEHGVLYDRNIFFPIYWYRQNRSSEDTVTSRTIFPVYYSFKNRNTDNNVFFPFAWGLNNHKYRSFTLLPLFSVGHSSDTSKSHFVFTPLFWHLRDNNSYRNTLFPLYWNYGYNNGHYKECSHILFPLYWAHTEPGKAYKVLFPLLWKFDYPAYSSFTLFPLISAGYSADGQSAHLVLSPLFWHIRDKDHISNTLFPIYWSAQHDTGIKHESFHVVFPLYWAFRDANSNNKVLFPLLWSFKNTQQYSFTLFPLMSSGRSSDGQSAHLVLSPLFWHLRDHDKISNTFFPLFWNRRAGTGLAKTTSNVLFPLYWAKKDHYINEKIFIPLLFSLKNPYYNSFTFIPLLSYGNSADKASSHLVVTPLFWHLQKHDSTSNVLFPLWWYHRNGTGQNAYTSSLLLPVYYAYKFRDTSNRIIFPLAWSFRNSNYHSFTLIPFFSQGRSCDGAAYHLVVTPFYWHIHEPQQDFSTVFPLYWSKTSGSGDKLRTHRTVFPLYWAYKDKNTSNKVLFPILWSLRDSSYHSFTFFPLYAEGRSTDSAHSYTAITPLYWHVKNANERRNILFPLYWACHDKQKNNKVLFPLLWSLRDSSYHSFTLFPLYSHGRSAGSLSSYTAVTPLFWHLSAKTKTQEEVRNVFFPLYWNKHIDYGNSKFEDYSTIFPLYWTHQTPTTDKRVFFPIVWSSKNPYYKSFMFFPVFLQGMSTDGSIRHFVFTPLFWHFSNKWKAYSRSVLFPLYWNYKEGRGDSMRSSKIIAPVYFAHKDSDNDDHVIFPLVWDLKDKNYHSLTFLPFFSFGQSDSAVRSHLVVGPLFWKLRNKDQVYTTLFPLYWAVKTPLKDNKALFPLLWSIRENAYRSFTFAPLFSAGHSLDHKNSHLAITPLFWHTKNPGEARNILFPLYWNTRSFYRDTLYKSNSTIFPIYWAGKGLNKNNQVIFPLLWYLHNSERTSFTLFPFLSWGHHTDNNKRSFVFTPLFWDTQRGSRHRQTLVPLYYYTKDTAIARTRFNLLYFAYRYKRDRDTVSSGLLWPLCEYESSPKSTCFRLAPVIWYKNSPAIKYFSIQPLFYHHKDSSTEVYQFLWQLYASRNTFNVKQNQSILWKAFWRDSYMNGDYETRLLYALYSNVKKKGATERAVLPFYYKSTETNGAVSSAIMLGFYNTSKRQVPDKKDFYQEERIFWFLRLRSNFNYLKAKGIIESRKQLR